MARKKSPELQAKLVADALQYGTCRSAEINGVAPATVIRYCRARGITIRKSVDWPKCQVCGTPMINARTPNRRTCSRACRMKIERTSLVCRYCGKVLILPKSVAEHRKYCSHECYAAASRLPNASRAPKRRGQNWKAARKERIKRQGGRCSVCGTTEATDVHHVIPYKYFKGDWQNANCQSNLVLLCKRCHRVTERVVKAKLALVEAFEVFSQRRRRWMC